MTDSSARRTKIARLEAEARRLGKLAQFEFSPLQAAFYRKRSAEVMAEAEALNRADIDAAARRQAVREESWLLRAGRDAEHWYNDRAAARMAGDFL